MPAEVWEVWSKQYVFFAPREWSYGPIAIIIEDMPANRKVGPIIRPLMQAFTLHRNGERKRATCHEMSSIVGGKIARSFYTTGEDGRIVVSKWRFLIWLLGGEWDNCRDDEMLFQLDYLLPYVPPTPAYFTRLQHRMNIRYRGRFYPQEAEEGSGEL